MQKSCCNAYEVAFPVILSAFTNILQAYAGTYVHRLPLYGCQYYCERTLK